MRKIVAYITLPIAEDDIQSMEAQIVKLVAELILMKKRLQIDSQTGERLILPTSVLKVPKLQDWLIAIGSRETVGQTLNGISDSVEAFIQDMAEFKENFNGGIHLGQYSNGHEANLSKIMEKSDLHRITKANGSMRKIIDKIDDHPTSELSIYKQIEALGYTDPSLCWESWKSERLSTDIGENESSVLELETTTDDNVFARKLFPMSIMRIKPF